MAILVTVILGIVQGVTEFLPVSSSGHLIILHQIFPLESINSLGFDVSVHLGTLLALIIYFHADITKYTKAFWNNIVSSACGIKKSQPKFDQDQYFAWLLILSTIPAILAALFFDQLVEVTLRNSQVVIWTLVIGGLLFFLVEKFGQKKLDLTNLDLGKTIFIGLAQAFALIPGVSRSGITITAAMALGFTRESAARFSFLMSVPIIFLAGLKKSYDLWQVGLTIDQLGLYFIGLVTSALVGYLAVKYFLEFVRKFSLNVFAWYRIILALLIFIFLT